MHWPAPLIQLRVSLDGDLAPHRVQHHSTQLAGALHGLCQAAQRLLVKLQRPPLQPNMIGSAALYQAIQLELRFWYHAWPLQLEIL